MKTSQVDKDMRQVFFRTQYMEAHRSFLRIYHWLKANGQVLDYQPSWANGTGYLDGLEKGAPVKEVWCFEDDKRRRGIVIPYLADAFRVMTAHENRNLVIFERYTDGQDGVLVANSDQTLRGIFASRLTYEHIYLAEKMMNPELDYNEKHLKRLIKAMDLIPGCEDEYLERTRRTLNQIGIQSV